MTIGSGGSAGREGPVAQIGALLRNEAAVNIGIVVSLVYTPPAQRNRGYASAAVAALSQQLLDAGWEFCSLFTDLANPTSNSIYQKVGYRPIADVVDIDFEDKP